MKYRFVVAALLLALALISVPAFAQPEANLTDGCVDNYDPTVDYFPEKVTLEYAQGFTVEYFNNYKLVTVVTPWSDATEPLQYALVQCGTPAPEDIGVPVVEVPVQTFVNMSTSFLPHVVGQGLLDRLVAVDSILYTSNEAILEKFNAGELPEIGGGGSGLEVNVEKLIELDPQLIMTQRFSSSDTTYPVIQQAGLPVVINADFLDTSPLGQAEWGKFIALFFNTEAKANETFDGVKTRYEDLKTLAAEAEDKPTVFANTPFGDSWFMPGGKSYLGQLLTDAGAAYLWADDDSTGSIPLDFETVFDQAADADFWVNTYQTTVAELLATDERFADFAALQNGGVYTNNARINANGGSDYYESGVANPDIILADLIRIFHPDLLPDHDLYFYMPLSN